MATEPDGTLEIAVLIQITDIVVVTPDGTIEALDGRTVETNVEVKALNEAGKTLDRRMAQTVAVCLNAIAAVVGRGQGLSCLVRVQSCDLYEL